jgi:hypothetical protein
MTAVEKVRIMLPHLIEHNRSHEQEFAKWSQVLRDCGQAEAAALLEKATASLREAAGNLQQALEIIGGPLPGHDLPHHHE